MQTSRQKYLIRGAEIIDGTGLGPIRTDVLVEGGKVAATGKFPSSDAEIIPGEGKWLVPGFIDVHSHSDFSMLLSPVGESKVCQGVTTEIAGNCGGSAFPLIGDKLERVKTQHPDLKIDWNDLAGYRRALDRRGHAPNLASLTGQGNLRGSVIGYLDRPAKEAEISRMKDLLEASLAAGSLGMSTGMPYPPGVYSSQQELISLLGVVADRGGVWATHMSSESDHVLEAIESSIQLAAETGVSLRISHLKMSGERNWAKLDKALDLIEEARNRGLDVTCDRYPYIASCTDLDILLPAWVWEGGLKAQVARLRDNETRTRIIREIQNKDWGSIVISSAPGDPGIVGKSLKQLALERRQPPAEALLDILCERALRVDAYFFSMSPENLDRIITLPYCIPASDASARPKKPRHGEGEPHPRAFGTFSRFLEKYVFSGKLSPGEGIGKITGLPAAKYGLRARGLISNGYSADLVLLDPAKVRDRADYNSPRRTSEGFECVMVNGVKVVDLGVPTGRLPGRFLPLTRLTGLRI